MFLNRSNVSLYYDTRRYLQLMGSISSVIHKVSTFRSLLYSIKDAYRFGVHPSERQELHGGAPQNICHIHNGVVQGMLISAMERFHVTLENSNDIACHLASLLPAWRIHSSPITVTPIPGGITNLIFKATHPFASPSTVLVRVFGAEGVFSTKERRYENIIFEQLGHAGHAPPLLALFANGRVETYLPARPLHLPEMVSLVVMLGVATAMARLHTFRPCHEDSIQYPGVWAQLTAWSQDAEQMDRKGKLSTFGCGVSACSKALREFQRHIEEADNCPVVFCHNDLLAGNILISHDDKINLVDFEYAGWNYRGFDIGNFFCEAMGGTTDGMVQPERYPSPSARTAFCRAYLVESKGSEPTEASVQELVQEADRFASLAHLYWGFWALVQSAGDTVDFPYVNYAEQRFRLYFSGVRQGSSSPA